MVYICKWMNVLLITAPIIPLLILPWVEDLPLHCHNKLFKLRSISAMPHIVTVISTKVPLEVFHNLSIHVFELKEDDALITHLYWANYSYWANSYQMKGVAIAITLQHFTTWPLAWCTREVELTSLQWHWMPDEVAIYCFSTNMSTWQCRMS